MKKQFIIILLILLFPLYVFGNIIMGGNTNTSKPYPIVTTNAATSIASTTATLNGSAYNYNSAGTSYFNYGLTSAYGSQTSAVAFTANTVTTTFSQGITGLTQSTTYHFQTCVNNSAGSSCGSDLTFITLGSFTQVASLSLLHLRANVFDTVIDNINNFLYIGYDDNTNGHIRVIQINLNSFTISGTIDVIGIGGTLNDVNLAIDITGQKLYVSQRDTSTQSSKLMRINLSTFTVSLTNTVTIIQEGMIYNGATLYANTNNSQIELIDPNTLTVSSTISLTAGYSGFTVVNDNSGNRYWIRATTPGVTKGENLGTSFLLANIIGTYFFPKMAVFDSINNKIYISGSDLTGTIEKIGVVNVLGFIENPAIPVASCANGGSGNNGIDTDGTYVYWNCYGSQTVYKSKISDGSTQNLLTTTGFYPETVNLGQGNTFIYYVGNNTNTASLFVSKVSN